VFALALLLQLQVADPNYASHALREFVARASVENRAPPPALTGYNVAVESELAFILRDSLGREIVGQVEQLAARAEWRRDGEYNLHVIGFRSQSLGSPYSALSFTRMLTVPTLYGDRLVVGVNDGLPRTRGDTLSARRSAARDSAAGRERFRAIHPLAVDRDRYYDFAGGDTVATIYVRDRAVRVLRVIVTPRHRPDANFIGFRGELDFDADRAQLVRMRGRLESVTPNSNPLLARATGAVAIVYMELENAEIDGRYWLPAFQRSEFQAQMGLLGDVRPIYRVVSRFHDYRTQEDPALQTTATDSMARTRATLTFASRDSVSGFGGWRDNLGIASGRVSSDDFDEYAPDVWRPTGQPIVSWWPRALEDIARYNRVEGMFTGVATVVRFRDAMPGLTARASLGIGWESQSIRGGLSASLARGSWIHGARAERTLANTADFPLILESGLSIGPLFGGIDDNDYVDRWTAALGTTRIFRSVDRALLTVEAAAVEDRPEIARLKNGVFGSAPFRANRNGLGGTYLRGRAQLEWHPRVTGESLSPGLGARILAEAAAGELDWRRVEVRLAARQYWHGIVFASRIDGGAVFGDVLPPQMLYEIGGARDLPSYEYKEFGGDRAAVGRGLAAYYFPFLRAPLRVGRLILPGISPGIGAGIQGGWTDASSDAARIALLGLGGDGITPLSRPTERIRATADLRVTLLSGAIGFGIARPVDRPGEWTPFFLWGASF